MATITTQQVVSFIQSRIAEKHAAGEDIVGLLENPEVAFSLQVLNGSYNNTNQAPINKAANENKNTGTGQLFMTVDENTNKGNSETWISVF